MGSVLLIFTFLSFLNFYFLLSLVTSKLFLTYYQWYAYHGMIDLGKAVLKKSYRTSYSANPCHYKDQLRNVISI
jgi:hypothetical protein